MHLKRSKSWVKVLVAAGSLSLVACGDEPAPAPVAKTFPAPTAAANIQPAAPAQPILMANSVTQAAGEPTAPAVYTYDFTIRDPFRPYISKQQEDQTVDSCGPLCTYDVGQFNVSGIIWGISQPAAMLRAPDGKPYIVKVGSPIGRNKGKVVSISKERIAVLEKYVNYRGEVVTNRVDIELPAEGGTRK
jgi:Tfp pilus assembly protein PilP